MTHGNDYYMYYIDCVSQDYPDYSSRNQLQEFNDDSHEGYNPAYQSYWNVI